MSKPEEFDRDETREEQPQPVQLPDPPDPVVLEKIRRIDEQQRGSYRGPMERARAEQLDKQRWLTEQRRLKGAIYMILITLGQTLREDGRHIFPGDILLRRKNGTISLTFPAPNAGYYQLRSNHPPEPMALRVFLRLAGREWCQKIAVNLVTEQQDQLAAARVLELLAQHLP